MNIRKLSSIRRNFREKNHLLLHTYVSILELNTLNHLLHNALYNNQPCMNVDQPVNTQLIIFILKLNFVYPSTISVEIMERTILEVDIDN